MNAHTAVLASVMIGLGAASATAQNSDRAPLPASPSGQNAGTQQSIDDLVAPIALYPDPLVAQILQCATSPYQVRQVNDWLGANQNLKGSELQDAASAQGFDGPFVAMVLFPDVLHMMANDPQWTQALGAAFSTNKDSVFDAIQRMRAKAKQLGNLESNDHQKVTVETVQSGQQVIVIEPANPQVIYVPQYNPQVVYVSSAPVYVASSPGYSAGTVAAAGVIGFTAGVVVGAAINDDWCGGWGWHGGCCYSGGWNNYYDHQEDMYKQYQKGRTDRTEIRQENWTERQGNRQDTAQNRQDNAGDRQSNRQNNAGDRQSNAQNNAQTRQGNRQDGAQNRQSNAQSNAQNRQSQWGQNGGYNNTRGRTQQSAQSSQRRTGSSSGAFSGYQNGSSQRAASSRGNQSLNRSSYGSRSRSAGGASRGGGGRRR